MTIDRQQLAKLSTAFDSDRFTFEGVEAWSARELQHLLGYDRWENFRNAIERAMESCTTAGRDPSRHFVPVDGELDITQDRIFRGVTKKSGRGRPREEMILSRFAAYLVAMNGDPSKEQVAFAQAYFAIQTRRMEALEDKLAEMDRLAARQQLMRTEKDLSEVLYQHGVDDRGFGTIRGRGDQALFGGLSTPAMKARLGCPDSTPLANYLQTVLIRAKDLSAEMTAYKTRASALRGVDQIGDEHVRNNRHVRGALMESGITPEKLPPAEDTRKVEARHKKGVKLVAKDAEDLPALPNPAPPSKPTGKGKRAA